MTEALLAVALVAGLVYVLVKFTKNAGQKGRTGGRPSDGDDNTNTK